MEGGMSLDSLSGLEVKLIYLLINFYKLIVLKQNPIIIHISKLFHFYSSIYNFLC